MNHQELHVLRTLRDWRAAGQRAVLATVVRTWGSSPRPTGSVMALSADGRVVGSVSGGCIEDDLIDRFGQASSTTPRDGAPQFLKYGLTAEEAHRFGLPCGGTLELLIEFDPQLAPLSQAVSALEAGQLLRRRVRLRDGGVEQAPVARSEPLHIDASSVSCCFGPGYRLLMIGAGPIADCLAMMAHACGFAVTLCDPRAERHGGRPPDHAALTTAMPDDAVRAPAPDGHGAVVALAHDPKLDDLALLEALDSPAFYVGAIGSRRNNQARRDRLATHFGHGPATLARLRGPIGLFIGSKTPPEIAVSVMAEIVAAKNGVEFSNASSVAARKDAEDAQPARPIAVPS
jgi:xanthine dehydrogenase accessory factor